MKKIFLLFVSLAAFSALDAQKIVPIEHNGKLYEVLDMTSAGKVTWGGYEEIKEEAARSQNNGAANTRAIVAAVGSNKDHEGKPYAARLCKESDAGGKADWYLPSKEEADAIYGFKDKFNVEERGSIWTSTEANGTQAITLYWYTGANYNNAKVETYHFLCIRKVE